MSLKKINHEENARILMEKEEKKRLLRKQLRPLAVNFVAKWVSLAEEFPQVKIRSWGDELYLDVAGETFELVIDNDTGIPRLLWGWD